MSYSVDRAIEQNVALEEKIGNHVGSEWQRRGSRQKAETGDTDHI